MKISKKIGFSDLEEPPLLKARLKKIMQLGHHLVSMLKIFISSIKQFNKDLYLNNLTKNLCRNICSLRKHPILLQPKHC